MGRNISEQVKRKLYAESMGRCMNPECKIELFKENGDLIEKAHITPYCDSKDDSFENLVVLCPNCHTNFDKNLAFTEDQVKRWKQIRNEEFEIIFCEKFKTFDELRKKVVPILNDNKNIFQNYYMSDNKNLWELFEGKILANNKMLKNLLEQNRGLIQSHSTKSYSNLELVDSFIMHIVEFQATRLISEKHRCVLFPKEINSLFGIEAVEKRLLPSVESLEVLISKLQNKGLFKGLVLDTDDPYIELVDGDDIVQVYLKDTPRLRQFYYDFGCFRGAEVRLDSLNFALKNMKSRGVKYEFFDYSNLREINVSGTKIIFIYTYCLSQVELISLAPAENCVLVNLHNWNGDGCISREAYGIAKEMGVTLLTIDKFFRFIDKFKHRR